jgi:nucleoside-diphosphate-sugar epimerase
MTILVTGASGFLGGHLVDDLLARGQTVRALVRRPEQAGALQQRGVETILGDVRSASDVARAVGGAAVVHHCAAAVGPHFSRREIYDTNLTGVQNVLEAVRAAGRGRVVLVSSVNVLGTRNLDPATEETPCRRSHDPAADVKIQAEQLAWDHAGRGVDVTVIRPGFIYGPGDPHNVPKLCRAIQRGKFAFIGSRDNSVPIVHVSDVVQAMRLAAETPLARGRAYLVTDGARTTIGELADYLAELLGCPAPAKVLPYALPWLGCVLFDVLRPVWRGAAPITRASLRFVGTSRFVDITRARQELGFQPQVSYRSGMAAAVRWYLEHSEGAAHVGASHDGTVACSGQGDR